MTPEEARAKLKRAHADMTPGEIAAHALELAGCFARQAGVLASCTRAFRSVRESRDKLHAHICEAVALQEQGKKRAARELLRAIASVPVPEIDPAEEAAIDLAAQIRFITPERSLG